MPIIEGRTTYDCAPTLDDDQVMAFCKEGYLALRGVVPEEVNARCMAFLHEHSIADHSEADARARTTWGRGPEMVSPRAAEPVELFAQEWFVDGVFLCPAVVGAVRTLLGPDFGLPVLLSNHRMTPLPNHDYFATGDITTPAQEQSWHQDGGARFESTPLHYLQCFYYPQAVTDDMGPTELCVPTAQPQGSRVGGGVRGGDHPWASSYAHQKSVVTSSVSLAWKPPG
jgi:hypothetical protein